MKESDNAFGKATRRKVDNLKTRWQQLHDDMNRWSPNDWGEVENIITKHWQSFRKEVDELTYEYDDLK
jgi:hypothetical protein